MTEQDFICAFLLKYDGDASDDVIIEHAQRLYQQVHAATSRQTPPRAPAPHTPPSADKALHASLEEVFTWFVEHQCHIDRGLRDGYDFQLRELARIKDAIALHHVIFGDMIGFLESDEQPDDLERYRLLQSLRYGRTG